MKVTLIRWRDAKTDPPEDRYYHWTDKSELAYYPDLGWCRERDDGVMEPSIFQPSVWCDPVPPGDDPLTLNDLRAVLHMLTIDDEDWHKLPAATQNFYNTVSARVRATLPKEDET